MVRVRQCFMSMKVLIKIEDQGCVCLGGGGWSIPCRVKNDAANYVQ